MKKLSSQGNVTEVQATSLLVSYWRYKEAKKPPGVRLIDDLPDEILLDALLTSEQRDIFENSPILECGIDALALRTRFIDDWLLHRLPVAADNSEADYVNTISSDEGGGAGHPKHATIVINPGAGMDARPYRLKELAEKFKYMEIDSNLSLLELKHSILQNGKDGGDSERTLEPYCPVTRAEADLSDVTMTRRILEEAGLVVSVNNTEEDEDGSNNLPSVDFVAEGLFAYLDPSCHKPLLQLCHDVSGNDSRMILTVLDPAGVRNFQSDKAGPSSSSTFQIPWKQLVPINVLAKQAEECGWKRVVVWQLSTMFDMYDRKRVSDLRGYAILTLDK